MKIIGIDPGPDGFAWAQLVDRDYFINHGEHVWSDKPPEFHEFDYVVIESIPGGVRFGKDKVATIEMIGRIRERVEEQDKQYVMIDRMKAAMSCGRPAFLKRGERYGDAQVNRYLRMIYPELRSLRPFNKYNHILAACAVAHCAVGIIQRKEIDALDAAWKKEKTLGA